MTGAAWLIVHYLPPLRKRERVGLSAGGAYIGRSTDRGGMGVFGVKRNGIAHRANLGAAHTIR